MVVLKEGRHIDRDEVDRIRAEGESGCSVECRKIADRFAIPQPNRSRPPTLSHLHQHL